MINFPDRSDQPIPVSLTLGLKSREIHDKQVRCHRITEIVEAMRRYADAEKAVPTAWVQELEELLVERGQ